MKKWIALLITILLLCQPVFAFAEEDDLSSYRTGKPWPCLELDGVVTEDMPAELKDNFALAVCRDFYVNAELVEDYGMAGTLVEGNILLDGDIAALFTGDAVPESEDAKLAKKLYDLEMDWDARNALGVQPLKDLIALLDDVDTVEELNDYFLNTPVTDVLGEPFDCGAMFDLIDPDIVVGCADTASLFLDSAEYGENPTELGEILREGTTTVITGMLERLGYSKEQVQQMTEDAFAFEGMIAPVVPTSEEQKQPEFVSTILNYYTREDALALEGKLPVVEFTEKYFGTQEVWLVTVPGFYELMQELYTDENIGMIKNWIICHGIIGYAGVLDRDTYDFYKDTVADMQEIERSPDAVEAASMVSSLLPWETAHFYCDTYATEEDKAAVAAITDDVIATYKEMLREETFISEETREAAISKLDHMVVNCMYPDDWEEYTYPDLTFLSAEEGGSYWDAYRAISEAQLRRTVEELNRPKDRTRWTEVPTVVNCFNDPSSNTINIMAAFCRGKIYNAEMSYEEILGAIGMVVAHEITHSFDANGSQFGESGEYVSWWTEEDYFAFMEKNDKLAAYFDNMTAWEGQPLNGSIMTGEACADMGALKCMLRMAADKEDFDYDAFFRSYATLWAEKSNLFTVYSYLQDEHPFAYLRVNAVLQQFDEFLDFYGITEGDGMYLAPEDRVLIW